MDAPQAFYLWVENAVPNTPLPNIADALLAELLSTYFKTTFLAKFTLARSQLTVRPVLPPTNAENPDGEAALSAEDLRSNYHAVWVAECPDRSGKISTNVTQTTAEAKQHVIEVPQDEGEDEGGAVDVVGSSADKAAATSLCFDVSLDLNLLIRSRKASAQTRRVSLLRQHMADYALDRHRQQGGQWCRCPFDPKHVVDMATLKAHLENDHMGDCLAIVADFALHPPQAQKVTSGQETKHQEGTTTRASDNRSLSPRRRRGVRTATKRGRDRTRSSSSSSSSSSCRSSSDESLSTSASSWSSRRKSSQASSEQSLKKPRSTEEAGLRAPLVFGGSYTPNTLGATGVAPPPPPPPPSSAPTAVPPAQPAAGIKSVHVGGYGPLDEATLLHFLLRTFGPNAVVAVHNVPSKQCAFVELSTEEMAVEAVRLWHNSATLDDGSRIRVNWAKYNVSSARQQAPRPVFASGAAPPPPPSHEQLLHNAPAIAPFYRGPPPTYNTGQPPTAQPGGPQLHYGNAPITPTATTTPSVAVQRNLQRACTAVLHLSSSEVSERSVYLEASQYGSVLSVTMVAQYLRALVEFDTPDAVQLLVQSCSGVAGGLQRNGCFQAAAEGMVC